MKWQDRELSRFFSTCDYERWKHYCDNHGKDFMERYVTERQAGNSLRIIIPPEYKDIPDEVVELMLKHEFVPPFEHFLHISNNSPDKISYTEDYRKGEADRQTVTTLGRYIRKHSILKDHYIAEIANLYRKVVIGESEIKWARSREEIKYVYENGVHSCMGKDASNFNTDGIHPCEVYATDDVAVAFIQRIKNGEGTITGRVITNEIDKTFNTFYGDSQTMKPMMQALGYDYGDLDGCRLLHLKNDSGETIVPYLDGEQDIGVYDDHLLVGGADGAADNESGLLSHGGYCDSCDSSGHDEDDMVYSEYHGYSIGQCCIDTYRHAYVGRYQDWLHEDDVTYVDSTGEYYTQEGLEYHDIVTAEDGEMYPRDECYYSEYMQEYIHEDNMIEYTTTSGDTDYLTSDMEHELAIAADTGETMLKSDLEEITIYVTSGDYENESQVA